MTVPLGVEKRKSDQILLCRPLDAVRDLFPGITPQISRVLVEVETDAAHLNMGIGIRRTGLRRLGRVVDSRKVFADVCMGMLFWNTEKDQGEIRHIYAKGAKGLRPDLS